MLHRTARWRANPEEKPMTTIHFLRSQPAAPERLICLHSSGASPRQWQPYREAFGTRFEVVTPELIGYGGAARWPKGNPVTLDDEARALAPLLQRGGVHLFGHSYGAAVALQLALRWPDCVRSLTLYEPVRFALLQSGAATAGSAEAITGVGRRIGMQVLSGNLQAAAAAFVDYWSGEGSWQQLGTRAQQALVERMTKVQAEFEALFADRVPAAAYTALTMPVQLLGGSRSPLPVRQALEQLESTLPDATRLRFDGLGHMGPLEDAPRIIAALQRRGPLAALRLAA
jgi:pimeloyl-ACP methyl ester carboxylesterase